MMYISSFYQVQNIDRLFRKYDIRLQVAICKCKTDLYTLIDAIYETINILQLALTLKLIPARGNVSLIWLAMFTGDLRQGITHRKECTDCLYMD